MRINRNLYDAIVSSAPDSAPEIGGILGGHGEKVECFVIDEGLPVDSCCQYRPNITELNKDIERWFQFGIDFLGIFHTHFHNVDSLSIGDKKYIETIMNNMPKELEFLFFPIITVPNRCLVSYRAYFKQELTIVPDNIKIEEE